MHLFSHRSQISSIGEEGNFELLFQDSGKLPTQPSPNLLLTPTSHLLQNVGLGERYVKWVGFHNLSLACRRSEGFVAQISCGGLRDKPKEHLHRWLS